MTIHTRSTLPFRVAIVGATMAAASLWIAHPHGAQAAAVDRGSRDYTLPEQMSWRDGESGRIANLYGDPSKPGLYAYLAKRGPNTWSMPHFHDSDLFVTVLEGTIWVGTGTFDPQRTVPLSAGSFVRDVARGIHFEGTKEEGATLYVVGIGPSSDHPAAAATVSGTGSANVIDPAISQIQRIEDQPKESFALYGDSSKPGLYLQYQRRAPNNWSTPHSHPIDRLLMVMGGTMLIGTGPSGDKTSTVAVPKGGFVHDIARGVHYDGSGNDPMWLLTAAIGPTATVNVDPPK
jgi:hypothetical protein